jgi:hypothetical protein
MRTLRILPAIFVCCTAAAQETASPPQPDPAKHRPSRNYSADELELPIPISSPRALLPGTIEPLTAQQKAARALKNSLGWKALANRALLAGIVHCQDQPEEWPGDIEGYGMRFGHRMARLAVREAIQLGADVTFKTDPRYDRCDCSGFLARTGHAWKRVLVARKDNGGETISISRLAGAYVTPIITDQWYPDRLNTWSHKLESGSMFLMWRGVTNMIREFWPEVSRKVPMAKDLYQSEDPTPE